MSFIYEQPAAYGTGFGCKNIVLVHGAFADGSNWSAVIALLQDRGYHVTAVQNPLTSSYERMWLQQSVYLSVKMVTYCSLAWAGGGDPRAGNANNVKGNVYLSALVPDSNQSVSDALAHFNAP